MPGNDVRPGSAIEFNCQTAPLRGSLGTFVRRLDSHDTIFIGWQSIRSLRNPRGALVDQAFRESFVLFLLRLRQPMQVAQKTLG